MPPDAHGHRRAVPPRMDDAQRERLRWLLDDPDRWVLRSAWERYLRSGDDALLVRTERLTQDHRVAAAAWLHQQRHPLYRALEGGDRAPDGWLEQLPMVRALTAAPAPTGTARRVPRQPGGPSLPGSL